MVDSNPEFEISDNDGSSVAFNVTATTTFQNVPSVAGNRISGFLFNMDGSNVEISTDGGTTYFQFPRNATGFKDVKGSPTQIQVRTSSGSTDVSLWIDFETY